ncbi:MAG: hypothetical protein AB7G39_00070 [Alphaproteobacteria bacterium]
MAGRDEHRRPTLTAAGEAAKAERQRRQAEQLRRNLQKRKAQSRARDDDPESGGARHK